MLPPQHLDGLERLAFYRASRAAEEEQAVVEDLMQRQEAGERLAPHEEAMIAYSPYGTAGGCPATIVAEYAAKG